MRPNNRLAEAESPTLDENAARNGLRNIVSNRPRVVSCNLLCQSQSCTSTSLELSASIADRRRSLLANHVSEEKREVGPNHWCRLNSRHDVYRIRSEHVATVRMRQFARRAGSATTGCSSAPKDPGHHGTSGSRLVDERIVRRAAFRKSLEIKKCGRIQAGSDIDARLLVRIHGFYRSRALP